MARLVWLIPVKKPAGALLVHFYLILLVWFIFLLLCICESGSTGTRLCSKHVASNSHLPQVFHDDLHIL